MYFLGSGCQTIPGRKNSDVMFLFIACAIVNLQFTIPANMLYYSGFRRKARVLKCKRFGRQKSWGREGWMRSWSRRSMRRPWKLGTKNATLLALRDRTRCFVKRVLMRIAPYTFISHTKMSIVFGKGQSTNYIA